MSALLGPSSRCSSYGPSGWRQETRRREVLVARRCGAMATRRDPGRAAARARSFGFASGADSQTGAYPGTQKVNAAARVAPNGETFTAVSELRDPDGNVVLAGLR